MLILCYDDLDGASTPPLRLYPCGIITGHAWLEVQELRFPLPSTILKAGKLWFWANRAIGLGALQFEVFQGSARFL